MSRSVYLADKKAPPLTPDAGVFELTGSPPVWIWAFTCTNATCDCREALVLVSHEGRDYLLARGAGVHEAWRTGDSYRDAAIKLTDMPSFYLGIDSMQVFKLEGGDPLDLSEHQAIADISASITGDTLDAFDSLWHRGKGWRDPEQAMLEVPGFIVDGWDGSDMLCWSDLCDGRQDVYVLDGQAFEAFENYCHRADCACGEVVVSFEAQLSSGPKPLGGVKVMLSGTHTMQPLTPQDQERLSALWRAFTDRHPNHLAHLARRNQVMKTLGPRCKPGSAPVPTPIRVQAKPGRNDPCPCGSGKKYKKCCGAG
jgi:hypothetical protein